MESVNDCCTICACDFEEGDQITTLTGCDHRFHVGCILQWFRYEHASCPNCRSVHSREVWTRRSPAQRIADMRRRKTLHPTTRRMLSRLDKARENFKSAAEARRHHRAVHRNVYMTGTKLSSAMHRARMRTRELEHHLSAQVGDAPLLTRHDSFDSENE